MLDGVGVGELPDAAIFKDEGSNTLGNLADSVQGLDLPNLEKFGLGNIIDIKGVKPQSSPLASYGKLAEVSKGKDSTTGHWELGGIKVDIDFPYYPNGFPEYLINDFINKTGIKGILGNKPASGTVIINELGDKHVETGFPIVYTSADSVFQIAAHEKVIPLNRLYEICEIARHKVLVGKDCVGRVIARPFLGTKGKYKRTTNRKDFSVNPPSDTILDLLFKAKIQTIAIGKIIDLYNNNGIKIGDHTKSNLEGIKKIISYSKK